MSRPQGKKTARLLSTLVAACAASLLLAQVSQAATYEIFPCSGHFPKAVGTDAVNTAVFDVNQNCEQPGGDSLTLIGENKGRATSFRNRAEWSLHVPEFAEIREVSFQQRFTGQWNEDRSNPNRTNLLWGVFADFTELEDGGAGPFGRGTPSEGLKTYVAGTRYEHGEFRTGTRVFEVVLECAMGEGCAANNEGVSATSSSIRVVLNDFRRPTVNVIGGSLLRTGSVHGTGGVSFDGLEQGAGLFFGEVLIDGRRMALVPANSNGGRCQEPFFTVIPCQTTVQELSASIDTATLSEGGHELRVVTCGVASKPATTHLNDPDCATSGSFSIDVRNTPVSKGSPTVSGAARPGSTLTATPGDWENLTSDPLGFSYQWLRCTAPSSCTPIAGATQPTYTSTAADVGALMKVEVTATVQADGRASASATSAPTDVVTDLLANAAAPGISGTARVGSPLRLDPGKWEDAAGAEISFAQRWLRCPADVADATQADRCAAIPGATAIRYTPVKEDAGKRLIALVTASVSSPQALSTTAASAPSDPIADPPEGSGGGKGNPPETTIARHPRKKTSRRRAKFAFGSDQDGVRFECKLDKGAFKPCHSPLTRKVNPGRHRLQARAISPAGSTDPTPASFRWRVS